MTRYALFLRGINVGGIRVPMPQLRATLEGIGCTGVKTWLNTGNVALDDARPADALKAACEAAIGEQFGYEAYVLVRPAAGLAALVEAWPFGSAEGFHRYVVFGGAAAVATAQEALPEPNTSGEAVAACGEDMMWRCPKGSSTTSPVAKALATKRWKPLVTTRNLNTVEKML